VDYGRDTVRTASWRSTAGNEATGQVVLVLVLVLVVVMVVVAMTMCFSAPTSRCSSAPLQIHR
jgi:hypothetical protein